MKNIALKKVKTENRNLQVQLESERFDRIKAEAKLERYEKDEADAMDSMARAKDEMQSQVIWLRGLVEKLAIKPEVIAAVGKQERRAMDMQFRFEEQRRRRDERMMAMSNKPGKSPKDYMF